jgi:AcrR family transcriptional regulator
VPDELHASLLDAAGRLIATEGLDALTVRRIAAEAGSSTMGVYSRFGGKEGVVDALLCEGFEALAAHMAAPVDTDDPVADLLSCAGRYRSFAMANPTRYQVMFQTSYPNLEPSLRSMTMAATSFEMLCVRVQRCLDACALAGFEVHEIAASMWATCHGLVSLELAGKRPPVLADDDPFERTLRALLRGFSPSSVGGGTS